MRKSKERQFVKSYPDLQYTPIWKNRILFQLYHYCLYHAGWAKRRWNDEIFLAGEFPMSQARCAKELGCSRSTVERYLKELENLGMIQLTTSFKGTRVSMIPADEIFKLYPPPAREDETDEDFEQEAAMYSMQLPEQQCPAASPAYQMPVQDQVSEDFHKLWLAYPVERRTRKQEAESLFRQAIMQGANLQSFLDCLERDRDTSAWISDQGQWIPGIAKWISYEGWREFVKPISAEEGTWTSR